MKVKLQIRRNDLRRRGRQLQTEVKTAIEDSLIISQQIARQLAAVDTGEMRDSIEITKQPRPGSLIGTLEAKAEHSGFVEYGTVNMDAQPFMTPAVEQGRRMFNKRTREVLKK